MNDNDLPETYVKLLIVHTESRREKIVAAFEALRGLSDDDAAFVRKMVRTGELDELALGQRIAQYRQELGECYRRHVKAEAQPALLPKRFRATAK